MENLITKNDKIFVAGHKGMVGSAIVRKLKNSGYFNGKYDGQLLVQDRNELDLTNSEDVDNWFKLNKPNVVILAAAKVGGIQANDNYPFDFISANLKIQQNIIENSWKYSAKRLLFLGSSCIYPKFANQPIREEELLTGPLEPTNEWYAIAKISGIKLCQSLRKQYGFDALSLMPTNLYGPGDNFDKESSHVFAAFIKRFVEAKRNGLNKVTCWGTGSPYREFLHVDDLANACLFVLEKWDLNSEVAPKDDFGNLLEYLNIGTGKDITIKDLAEKIASEANFDGEIIWDSSKKDGTPRKQLDISRIRSLGWEPKISLEDGIKQTINTYKNLF